MFLLFEDLVFVFRLLTLLMQFFLGLDFIIMRLGNGQWNGEINHDVVCSDSSPLQIDMRSV